MRCFIAIDIDEQIRKGLSNLQNELRRKVDIRKGDVKWVNPEITHLTLKFLGEIKDDQIAEVCNVTADVAARHGRFDLDVRSVGYFGGRSARVLWVGTGEDCEKLVKLHDDLERQLEQAGWPREGRKFAAHLTLCRVKNSKAGIKLAQASRQYKDFGIGTLSADSVTVYQSELTPQGPIYTALGNYDLQ
ncbi:MAG: RNA 2',3'-cyclic phosphodiesterase [Phycisphaerales bacterium]|nr:MAG: RNA 2',3'-cyclic phosphodiesterase [Phycisphaerales bacterium]